MMKTNILVIDNNKSKYIEKYKLFENPEEAVKYFNELGYSKYSMGMPIDLRIGIKNMVDAGEECNIELINLEVR